jgi:Fe2+ or Zn2+ uptake regulation protein
VNEIVGRLRERRHRLTRQRYAVVRALVEGGEHPSTEQLFHLVSDAYPMMSRATVYKTLDTLNAADEVLELSSSARGRIATTRTFPAPTPRAHFA